MLVSKPSFPLAYAHAHAYNTDSGGAARRTQGATGLAALLERVREEVGDGVLDIVEYRVELGYDDMSADKASVCVCRVCVCVCVCVCFFSFVVPLPLPEACLDCHVSTD